MIKNILKNIFKIYNAVISTVIICGMLMLNIISVFFALLFGGVAVSAVIIIIYILFLTIKEIIYLI